MRCELHQEDWDSDNLNDCPECIEEGIDNEEEE